MTVQDAWEALAAECMHHLSWRSHAAGECIHYTRRDGTGVIVCIKGLPAEESAMFRYSDAQAAAFTRDAQRD